MAGKRKPKRKHPDQRKDPTPAQIAEMCREIRQAWSEATERTRAGLSQHEMPGTIPRAKLHREPPESDE